MICEILALILADNLQHEKCYTGPFSAPNRKTRPDQLQLVGPLRKISRAVAPRDTEQCFGNPSDPGILFRMILDRRLLKIGGSSET